MEFFKILFLWLLVILLLVIAFPVFLVICAFATLLWPISLIWSFFEWVVSLFTKKQKKSDWFQEFIFVCYGLAILCMLIPISIIDDL